MLKLLGLKLDGDCLKGLKVFQKAGISVKYWLICIKNFTAVEIFCSVCYGKLKYEGEVNLETWGRKPKEGPPKNPQLYRGKTSKF